MIIYDKDGNILYQCTDPSEIKAICENIANNLSQNYYTSSQVMSLIASSRAVYQVATLPANPSKNTIYYVGSTAPYNVKLIDSNGTVVDLGSSSVDLTDYQKSTDNNLTTTAKTIVGAINEIATDYSKKPEEITNQLALTFYENNFSILDNNIKCIKIAEGVYYIFMTFVNNSSYVVPLNTEIRILTDMKINGVRPRACVLNAINVTNTSIVGCTYNGVGALYANLTSGSGIIRIRVSGVLTTI